MYILLLLPLAFSMMIYRNKENKIVKPVLYFYLIGSCFAVLMTLNSFFKDSMNYGFQSPSIVATLFLILCNYILCLPLTTPRYINASFSINRLNFTIVSYFFIVISLLYCIASIPFIMSSFNSSDFSAYKADVLQNGLNLADGNPILSVLFKIQLISRPIITFMFCYAIAFKPCSKRIIIALAIISILPPFFHSLAAAHRNIIVFAVFDFILCYTIFKNQFSKHINKIFYTIGLVVILAMLFIVLYFAFLRFGGRENGFLIFMFERYWGEPFVDFNTMLWGNEQYLYGNKCFPLVRQLLGLDFIDPKTIRETTSFLKYENYYFYSSIGNLYMDFGPWGTLFLCIICVYVFMKLLKRVKRKRFTSLLFLYIYGTIHMRNYFYFYYMGYSNTYFLYLVIMLFIIYILIENGETLIKYEKVC